MGREFQATVPKEMQKRASAEFCHSYGLAMAEWAGVERSLYHWFAAITRMPEGMARAVFYSARSFNGRAEMLEAAIDNATKQTQEEIEFISAALRRAWGYSGFRNAIAHGEPFLNLHLSGPRENAVAHAAHYQLVQGKSLSLDPSSGNQISIAELGIAAKNFKRLAHIITDALPQNRSQNNPTPGEYRQQVDLLPTEANSKTAQTPQGPSPPQQRGHVNKKAHRTARTAAKAKPHKPK